MIVSSIIWDTSPDLVNLGPFTVRWYGFLFALGFFLGYLVLQRIFRREGKPENDVGTLLLYVLCGAIIGARLGHCLLYEPAYYLARPGEILLIWRGGLASHGGAAGILIALYFYNRNRPGQTYLWLLDRIAIPVALAGSLIRIGNLFNSEIIGTPSRLPWALVFARAGIVPLQPRHPAMLYEAAAYLAIFCILLFLYRKQGSRVPPGELIGLFLITVFTARFLIEYVKVPQAAYRLPLPLSVGQLLSVPAVIAGIILLAGSRKRRIPRRR
ncbi:MAG: prolipoprotein diacylglyceryl transferase [Candidatus Erginobacter occultus]|nr:prolipoprotein diacylglyceryl transferase [Candidatus Erginobacter occultus]